jgi:hypothetical protein
MGFSFTANIKQVDGFASRAPGLGENKNALAHAGDERAVRGATPVRLADLLTKTPADVATGGKRPASLVAGTIDFSLIPFALITVATPAQANQPLAFRPATPRSIRRLRACGLSPLPALWNAVFGEYSSSSQSFSDAIVSDYMRKK